MADLKKGDLVMITKAARCCGSSFGIGSTFVIEELVKVDDGFCMHCLKTRDVVAARASGQLQTDSARLTKIDPPSEGDSLPTRADLKLEA